jgi:hypothetical protein
MGNEQVLTVTANFASASQAKVTLDDGDLELV